MISKKVLCKRLSVALGKDISLRFPWFFGYFCDYVGCEELRQKQLLELDEVEAFSRFCGYDLKYPIPIPLW